MVVYVINAIRNLSGQEPTEVSAISSTTKNDARFKEVEETISLQLRYHLWMLRRGQREDIAYTPVNHFAAMMDHLSECVVNDKKPLTPGEEGVQDLKIVTAAYQSALEGKPVKIL